MRLAGVPDVIVDVIKRCRLEKVFRLRDTVEDALALPDEEAAK